MAKKTEKVNLDEDEQAKKTQEEEAKKKAGAEIKVSIDEWFKGMIEEGKVKQLKQALNKFGKDKDGKTKPKIEMKDLEIFNEGDEKNKKRFDNRHFFIKPARGHIELSQDNLIKSARENKDIMLIIGIFIKDSKDGKELEENDAFIFIIPYWISKAKIEGLTPGRFNKSPNHEGNIEFLVKPPDDITFFCFKENSKQFTLKKDRDLLMFPFDSNTAYNYETQEKIALCLRKEFQTILFGPPGTGKTYLARKYIDKAITDQKEIELKYDLSGKNYLESIAKMIYHDYFAEMDGESWNVRYFLPEPNEKDERKDEIIFYIKENANNNMIKITIAIDKPNKKLKCTGEAKIGNADWIFITPTKLTHEISLENSGTVIPSIELWLKVKKNKPVNSIAKYKQEIIFHQATAYEEFIEGIFPRVNSPGGTSPISFEIRNGLFKDFVKIALRDWKSFQDDAPKYYFLIDEINRGNISNIFGEIITLLENDKRLDQDYFKEITENDNMCKLPFSKEYFGIPPNILLIGTMNSTDRSIALVDIALRRRFAFISCDPMKVFVSNYEDTWEVNGDKGKFNLKSLFAKLNSNLLRSARGKDYRIGHAYFMNIEKHEDLYYNWYYRIIPLLIEYFHDEKQILKGFLMRFLDNNQDIKFFSDGDEFLQALTELTK